MKVKVCGITGLEQLKQLQQLQVDYAGMIFYEGSKRYAVEGFQNQKSEVRELKIKKTGVFVNADYKTIIKAIKEYGLTAVQLHGDETDEFCLELMDKAEVIKVFRISQQQNIDELVAPFQNVCHYFLFDTDTAAYGGSGRHFDWSVLKGANIGKPFFLSGGIGLEDVEKIKALHHPHLHAVDVNSRFETTPGVKDIKKIEQFLIALSHA